MVISYYFLGTGAASKLADGGPDASIGDQACLPSCRRSYFPEITYLWLVGNGGMGYNYNYYYYHSSIPY